VIQLDECLCPPLREGGVRHPKGDSVLLKDPLDFRTAATIQHAISVLRLEEREPHAEEILARLTEAYVRYGITAWTLLDPDGKPIPVTPATVDQFVLSNIPAASVIGDEADEMYSRTILLPLVKRASASSPSTPTPDETSATTSSPENPEPPTPLRRSSTTTTPTDDTVRTSPRRGGGSKSSRSSESVA
jgi:hypothetical protein